MIKNIVLVEESLERQIPENFNKKDDHLFKMYWETIRPECHVHLINNAYIIKDTVFLPSKLKFFDRYTHYNGVSFLGKLMRIYLWVSKRKIILGKSVWIHDNFSGNYFHWFAECLPRLLFSEAFQEGHVVILPKSLSKFSFVKESLDLMGVKFEFFEKNQNYVISELILTSLIGRISEYRKELLVEVGHRLKVGFLNIKPWRKIYIRRKPAKARNILNEEAVLKVMEEFQVEVHDFEGYSLMEQIKIINATCLLVSIHGAGLTNMIFMPYTGSVLEFRNEVDGGPSTNCYFNLSSELGIKYFYLTNKSTSPKTNHADFTIDIKKLRGVLKELE
ncbi:glycosyltransferase family 61 protein [Aquiflexum sp. TKW24L]|uniref:glycosyltransferase family 61 protein n=1 Tax=Aquiflexum sp. TKW24L TaxID=2942212 RepID=UPI0020C16A42|nr:glycosyltransferase family 61 protein [Aquiflexum sp. TKW24L]MCL6260427.1 glycosyltransferase family 61 protein [Aquiflexum sp. TKW24L]